MFSGQHPAIRHCTSDPKAVFQTPVCAAGPGVVAVVVEEKSCQHPTVVVTTDRSTPLPVDQGQACPIHLPYSHLDRLSEISMIY